MSLKDVFITEAVGNISRILGMPEQLAAFFEKLDKRHAFSLAKLFKDDIKFIQGAQHSFDANVKKARAGDKEANDSILRMAQSWSQGSLDASWPVSEILAALKKNPSLEKQVSKVDGSFGLKQIAFSGRGKDPRYANSKSFLDLGKGWQWVEVEKDCHGIEGSEMQHCGVTSADQMLSLRDSNGKPHVTLDLSEDGMIGQIRGKQNEVPNKKYWPAIASLFTHLKKKGVDVFYAEEYEADRTGASGSESDFQNWLMDQGLI